MTLPDRAGTFRGKVVDLVVGDRNDKPEVGLKVELTHMYAKSQKEPGKMVWRKVPDNLGWEITAYLYLEKSDGDINEVAISQLKEALGWNPASGIGWLESTDLTGTDIQLDIQMETYQGKTGPKVKWIRAVDAAPGRGGLKAADAETLRRFSDRLDAKLRAMEGGVAPSQPAKTTQPKAATPAVQEDSLGEEEEDDIPF